MNNNAKRIHSTEPGEQMLLQAMQQHLLTHLPTEWDALHPEEHQQHPTLWEQLLAIPNGGKDYGVDEEGAAAVAVEAVATTYGLELAMATPLDPGIRVIAEFVGMPYKLLLQKYIDKYAHSNNGTKSNTRRK